MGVEQTDIRRFRSRPTSPGFSPDKIDAEAGVIYDVVMVEEGPAKGHEVHLEGEFIEDLVAYDQANFGERGVKSRLGHPGMSADAMGTQLGFFRNVRKRKVDGKMQAVADLHLLASADLSPDKPNAREWVLSMAAEAPDFIMSSIVFRPGRYYQRDKEKKKKYVWEYKNVKDDDGNERQVWVSPDSTKPVFVEFGENGQHFNTDLVEQGAATDHLFSHDANPHLFVVQAETFLHEHPQLLQFIQQNPDKVRGFFERILNPGLSDQNNMATETTAPVLEMSAETLAEQLEAAREEGQNDAAQAYEKRLQAIETSFNALQTTLNAINTRLAAIESAPAAQHTAGETEQPQALSADKPYLTNPVFLRAQAMANTRTAETN